MKKKIIIIEDQQILNEMLKNTLSDTFEVVATSTNAKDMLKLCNEFEPDIVLTDILTANNENGITNGAKVKEKYKNKIKVIALTGVPDITFLEKAKEAKIDAFLYKNITSNELINSLEKVLKGNKVYLDNKDVNECNILNKLTKKELKILTLLCEGMDREDIAFNLDITMGTLKNHISSILNKLEFESVSKLLIYCISNGYITNSK